MSDLRKLDRAYRTARKQLLAERVPQGHWIGELSNSALSTATAVSALALVERHAQTTPGGWFVDETRGGGVSQLIVRGLEWLAAAQNEDGGWGDTDQSYSNVATTMLVRAAFCLTGVPAKRADLLERAEAYLDAQGGVPALRRRYGKDKTFAVPILTNCALAGLVPWSEVSPLPFELACLPQKWFRFLNLPVVSYAIPALVAIGQARHVHRPSWNPLVRRVRQAAMAKSLDVLDHMQPASGGFLEATPLTSFVVMSLASIGQAQHPVVRRSVQFLLDSVREDGSWPIDTNLATWNTTLAINALGNDAPGSDADEAPSAACLDWLLDCQNKVVHPYTGCEPGGWGWSDLSGSVPDVDDTSGALLALANWPAAEEREAERIRTAAEAGIGWLLDLQNSDGGWPTFCRGWGTMPFDRSGSDLTAHALRAVRAWGATTNGTPQAHPLQRVGLNLAELTTRMEEATARGLRYLARHQHPAGSWTPLWFGNQDHPQEESPVYGTARVLLCYRDLGLMNMPQAQLAVQWLVSRQNADGGWGGWHQSSRAPRSCVEETALAVEALAAADGEPAEAALRAGAAWLVDAVETDSLGKTSPIGFYFAKLWYYERLYPLSFSVAALRHACRRLLPPSEPIPHATYTPAYSAHA